MARPVTCDDCYFRRELLCALRLPAPCPTFRPATNGGLAPPLQPPLVATAGGEELAAVAGGVVLGA
jgi:hypothetical protein